MAESRSMPATDPRHSAAFLLEVLRDGRWRTRAELVAISGQGWPLLLRALERDRHVLAFDRSKVNPRSWFRVRLAYEAGKVAIADDGPEQLALAVCGSAPPASAVFAGVEAA